MHMAMQLSTATSLMISRKELNLTLQILSPAMGGVPSFCVPGMDNPDDELPADILANPKTMGWNQQLLSKTTKLTS